MERKIKKQYRTRRMLIISFILLSATSFALADNLTKFSYYRSLPNENTTYKEGELIVHFANVKPGIQPNNGPVIVGPLTKRAVKDTISDFIIPGSSVAKEYEHIKPGLALVKLPEDVPTVNAFLKFNRSANILYAEPNYKIKLLIIPDDTRFFEQWALNNFGQLGGTYDADIDAPEAWDIRTDSNTVVAVLDTGIDYTHPDLADNMWINPAEVNDPCVVTPADFNDVDDDENGYVDDIYGYDFVDDDSEPFDEHFHGTHVAGIIGAVGNNDIGVAGVCWRVKLMALRMLDAGGAGTIADAMEAIDYATKMGVDVINASWGNYEYSYMLYNIIADAQTAGILFVASAGNESFGYAAYPAAYNLDNIISVMATNDSDNKWEFSNYGYNVDLGAPGEDILSTTPTEQTDVMTNAGVVADYDYLSGTSMAAPHVSGACALLKAESPTSTYRKIKALIFRGVDPVLPGLCVTGGRLNLFSSLNMAQTGTVLNVNTTLTYTSIQAAIDAPQTLDGHLLVASAGYWYFEIVDFHGKKVHLRSGNLLAPGFGPLRQDNTYISAFIDKYFATGYVTPVVTFSHGEDNNADIAGFTITDGDSGIECSNNSSPDISYCNITKNEDRGIYCWNSSPAISDCNIAENEGSGIYCNNADPNISDCKITMNTSQGSGGGIYCNYGSDPDINDCLISYNVIAGQGGGMYIGGGSNPDIRNSIIFENEADWEGGGIYINNASPTITDSNITGCISHWDGGGIYCDNGSNPNIQNCTINNNMAYFDGGAIYCNGTSPLIKNCLIIDNTVDGWDCGGIFCWDASPTITNCTLAGNSSNEFDGVGGAMFCLGKSKPVITNCIFSDNNDTAIYEYELASDPNIKFSLFYNNPNGDYYDKDSGAIHDFNSLDPDNFLATMRHYDISNTNDSNNIDGKPMFVRGKLGNYYLSQFAAGQILDANGVIVDPIVNPQDATSPAVDAGSTIANVLGMHIYSTRTDNVADSGKVDIGFHYNDPEPAVMYYLSTQAINGTISPPSGSYIQYKQVLLEGTPADPNYQLKYWWGTDDDTSKELRNIVTMDYHKDVDVVFETILVYLRCRVVGGIGTLVPISPDPVETIRGRYYLYHRGTVVNLAATPANPERRAKWGGDVDNEFSRLLTNTVTMADGPYPVKRFTIDTQGKDCKVVDVEFYQPRILNVPGDYTNIQHAIYNANDDDIVLIAPGFYDIPESSLPYENTYLYISGKAITLSSINPDDPCVVAATIIYNCGFVIEDVNRGTVIDGLTIQSAWYGVNSIMPSTTGSGVDGLGGHMGDTYGGGMELRYNASPTVRNCRFIDCAVGGAHGSNGNSGADERGWGGNGGWPGAAYGGGASVGWNCWPIFTNCSFIDCFVRGGDGGNGGSSPPGHGGGWGDPDAPWWWEYWDVDADGWGPLEEYWKYTGFGGAVYCAPYSNPEFVDCNFINNHAYGGSCGISGQPIRWGWPYRHYRIDSFGGAVYADYSSAPVFTGCNFINNEADVSGPATHLDGGEAVSDDPYISYGGAIAFEDSAKPTFINCSFNDNIATIGGGMWATWADPNLVGCNFIQNTAFHGGGVYFVGGTAKITQNNFRENEALYDTSIIDPINPDIIYGEGGAIYCFDGDASIADCDIFNNTAGGSGGGIYISGSAKPLVKNCLITENFAIRDGGGISANWHSKSNIVNCTIAKNAVTVGGTDTGFGGGLNCSYNSLVNILNSIIWGNYGTRGSQLSVCTGFKYDPIISTVDVNNSVIGPPEEVIEIIPAEVLDINVTNDASTLVNTILGSGIEVVGIPQYTGADTAAGTFEGGLSAGIGIESGIILTSGDANLALPPNNSDGITGGDNLPGDPDLTALLQVGEVNEDVNTYDATILEFTFKSKGGNLFFNFVFASDEYNEFTNSQYNDVFGFFFDGTNIALIPGTTTPVTINNVNGGNPYGTNASNSHLFNNNDLNDGGPFFNIEYDGFTDVFTAQVYNVGSGTHTIKLAIADTSDYALDSAVFIQAGSFSDKPLFTNPFYIDKDCKLIGWIPNAPDPKNPWEPDTYNLRIDADPCFVAGYYLSQIAAGQSVNSPCVDSGSANANAPSIGLDTYTTRTDSVSDSGIVDMGYHYLPFIVPQYKLTVKAFDVNVIEPNIYAPDFDGYYNWYTTVPLRIESTYDANIYQVSWSGTDNDDPNYGGSSNTVTMDSDKTVTIRLLKSKYELTINVDGGNGKLSAEWSEDDDLRTIVAPYTENIKLGTVVKLTAKPNDGYRVKRWIGTDNDGSRATTNTVTIDSDRTVRVEFGRPVTINVPGDYSTIQAAVSAAEEGDTIVVYGGTYDGNINLQGKEITLVCANPDDSNVIAVTIIDCGENGRGFIFNSGENANTIINGFTIIDGNVYNGNDGGGIFIDSGSSPTIMNTVISDCNATGDPDDPNNPGLGGGIYINADCSPSFINCAITYCSADGGGGAFCNFNSSPTFRHCNFSNNLADWGGGLLCGDNSSATIIDCDFINNQANRGGGVYGEPNSLVTIDESTFTNNIGYVYGGAIFWLGTMEIFDTNFVGNEARHGGGMFCAYSEETTIVGCTLMQNRAGPFFDPDNPDDPSASVDGRGGGIFCFAAPALVRDCIINHNVATTSGGAIYISGSSNSPQLSNCLITNNLAGRDGGGISINWYAEPLISNCTFISNAAIGTFGEAGNTGFGGGLYCSYGSDSEVIDSIFWNNYALKGSEIAVGTGFEFDPRPSTLTITYSDIKTEAPTIWVENGCTLVGWNQVSNSWNPDTHNIKSNPLFVTGPFGDYYLSQISAGQSQNSPCVSSGSDLASNLDMVVSPFNMLRYTTRTDSEFDKGIVDMGYHYYATIEPCRYCDLVYNGFIDFKDFAMFTLQWLSEGCSDDNNWCQGADITYNTVVDFDDLINFLDCWLAKDNLAPIPNPSEWNIEPYLISSTSIGMSAKTGFDTWGWSVEYLFKCIYGNCHDSSWQSSPTYTDSGLAPTAVYGYMVKSRDALGNETEWSDIRYAGQEDTTPPAPAPYIDTIGALGSNSVTMTSTTAYDESGVEYYFDCNTAGGHDSSWQSSPTYIDSGLAPNTTYYYRVKARDNSPANNETAWSNWVSVTTILPLDNLPPEPNPMAWDPTEDANGYDGEPRLINIGGGTFDWYATMRAVQAADVAPLGVGPSGVEYKFVCVTSGLSALSSPWQIGLTYTVQVGGKYVVTDWYVIARDTSPNHNTTAASPVVRALPPP